MTQTTDTPAVLVRLTPAVRIGQAGVLAGFDAEVALDAAADPRPWGERAGWQRHAACRGAATEPFLDGDGPTPAAAVLCRTCPVRTRCAVDGLRMNRDGFLAAEPDGVVGGYGGLDADEAWLLAQAIRTEAAEQGVVLFERSRYLATAIVAHHDDGLSPREIADAVDASVEEVWDALIPHLVGRGHSNRVIAPALGTSDQYRDGVSYKWVERRRKVLGCTPADLAAAEDGSLDVGAADVAAA